MPPAYSAKPESANAVEVLEQAHPREQGHHGDGEDEYEALVDALGVRCTILEKEIQLKKAESVPRDASRSIHCLYYLGLNGRSFCIEAYLLCTEQVILKTRYRQQHLLLYCRLARQPSQQTRSLDRYCLCMYETRSSAKKGQADCVNDSWYCRRIPLLRSTRGLTSSRFAPLCADEQSCHGRWRGRRYFADRTSRSDGCGRSRCWDGSWTSTDVIRSYCV